jgi:AcrR family transcriptional regulator
VHDDANQLLVNRFTSRVHGTHPPLRLTPNSATPTHRHMADRPTATTSGRGRRATLEQERSRRTKAALVAAAERLWGEQGVDAVTVAQLCGQAGVSKGLFYFYFASKEDLLVELLLADADQVAVSVGQAVEAGDPIDQVLQKGLAVMARRAQRHPRHLLARAIAEWFAALERHAGIRIGHTPLQTTFTLAFAHGQQRGEVESALSPDELGGLLEWALLGAELEWAMSTNRQPSLVKRLWSRAELVLRGARP